jgi:TRAP-type C4-dicarboxylate transport system substrate-binding protein
MKRSLGLAMFAALCAIPLAGRAAEPIQLKFADPGRPDDWVYQGIQHWISEVEKGSGGLVAIKIYAGGSIATFRNVYDRLLNGVADAAFGTFGGIADQYPKTSVSGLPFISDRSSSVGMAMWRLYADGLISDEFTKVKPIAMFGFGSAGLHFVKPIKSVDELKGLKILVNGRSAGKLVDLLGATPLSSNPAELYEGLNRGLAQGIEFTFTGLVAFKLAELAKHHLDVPMGTTGGYFLMNNESYRRLPEKARRAVDMASGEPATRDMGKRADVEDDRTRALVLAGKGQVLEKLPAAEVERVRKLLAPYTEEWVKETLNGAAVLAAYRAAIDKFESRK